MASNILLESGTNEVEIMEFSLGGQGFGINVAKVQTTQLLDPAKMRRHPNVAKSDPFVGYYAYRDDVIPLIDLGIALQRERKGDVALVIATEFNGIVNAFIVDMVEKIHRISWKDISPVSDFVSAHTAVMTGSVLVDKRQILLVDLEFIIAKIFPNLAI